MYPVLRPPFGVHWLSLALSDGRNGVGTIPFLHLVVKETMPVSETLGKKTQDDELCPT
jgi:hypothetical protein